MFQISNIYGEVTFLRYAMHICPMAKPSKADKRIKAIASEIKRLRIKKGSSSYENFALDNELPRVQYWRMEKGANFRINSLFKIIDAHGITLSEFFKNID